MDIYPYSAPIILTDVIFAAYGGNVADSSATQRTNAYWLAEMAASEDLNTFLLPTVYTGTYLYKPTLILEHAWVQAVLSTRFIDNEETTYYTVNGTDNVYVDLLLPERGVVRVDAIVGTCNCHSHGEYPHQVQVVYRAGLNSGTSYKPDILLALTTYAQIILNEIVGYGNEAPGDVGVQEFKNQQYSEKRVGLIRTTFGTSAKAQFAHRLLTKLRKRRFVGI